MVTKKKKKKVSPKAPKEETPEENEVNHSGEENTATSAQAAAAKAAYQKANEPVEKVEPRVEVCADGESTDELRKERDSYLQLAQKTKAEFDNFRKRVERERGELKRESLGAFLREFFGAFDDLDRALKEGEEKHSYETFHNGVKLVRENLWKVIEKAGVQRIEAEGQKFDPRFHEAMTMVPSPAHEPNTVMEVFQQGYIMGDFVLRPARVVVAAAAQ